MLRTLAAAARALGLPGRRVLVACSGGVDSVSLLHGLVRLSRRLELELAVGHVDHGLRAGSEEDAAFVQRLARKEGLAVRVTRVAPRALRDGVPSRARPTLQEAARRARYDALRVQARELGAECIATAHHRDDQAETVLLRLLRGAGPDALGGIPERSPDGRIVRPLLGVGREEILGFARAEGLAWREDPSNGSRDYARNRLRHDWIPGLAAAFNPRALRAIADLAEAVRRDGEWAAERVDALEGGLLREEEGSVWIDPAPWAELPEALARRLARRALRRVGVGRELTRAHLLRCVAFLRAARPGTRIELPGRVELRRERTAFRLVPGGVAPPGSC